MSAVDATQVASAGPVSTTERLAKAWSHASQITRRATVLAAGISPIVGAAASERWPMAAGAAAAGTLLALAALVDVHERRLPNRLLGAAAAIVVVASLTNDPTVAGRVLVGGLIGGGLMLLARLRGGVGMGDVKAGAVVGAAAGTVSVVAAPVAIAVAALVAALTGMWRGRRSLPLGPALWLGWAVASAVTSMGRSAA